MNKDVIKKLARISAKQKKIGGKTAEFILKSFNRKQLTTYLRYLRKSVEENSVRIFSSIELNGNIKRDIESKFPGKDVFFHVDEEVGDGIRVQIDDTIIDLTTESYLNQTIEELKQ